MTQTRPILSTQTESKPSSNKSDQIRNNPGRTRIQPESTLTEPNQPVSARTEPETNLICSCLTRFYPFLFEPNLYPAGTIPDIRPSLRTQSLLGSTQIPGFRIPYRIAIYGNPACILSKAVQTAAHRMSAQEKDKGLNPCLGSFRQKRRDSTPHRTESNRGVLNQQHGQVPVIRDEKRFEGNRMVVKNE